MRNLEPLLRVALQSRDAAGQHAQAGDIRCLVASFEQPLHSETDAEQRLAAADLTGNRIAPWADERSRGFEVADTGDNQRGEALQFVGRCRCCVLGAERGQRLADRRQVAGAVVDQRNHSSPFVLGSIFASRASRAHATRNARANALNTASMW